MLRQGSRGSSVRDLQKKLKAAGFDPGPIDGIFGPKTQAAVMAFQRAAGISVDGIAGPQTFRALSDYGTSPSSGGGGGSDSGPSLEKSEAEMAAQYGLALSVINSDPSLRAVFDEAIRDGTWTTEKFVARARETDWYKKNSEAARQATILKNADPATWNSRIEQMTYTVSVMAQQMGAPLDSKTLRTLSEQAVTFGWNEDRLRSTLAGYVRLNDGKTIGRAAQWETELRSYARDFGVRPTDAWLQSWLKAAAKDNGTSLESAKEDVRRLAISAYPHLAERLNAGESLTQIASGYIQTMAQTLELDPGSIDVFNPTIKSALGARDKDGKPIQKSLWEFEKDLRKDPRWAKTKQAMSEAAAIARQIGTDFGLAF